jgi:hypothetical protein
MDTPQNGSYVAPEGSKSIIPDMDEALLGHDYDDYGTPILIYSVDLILDILETENPHLTDTQIIAKWDDLEANYGENVIFCYT